MPTLNYNHTIISSRLGRKFNVTFRETNDMSTGASYRDSIYYYLIVYKKSDFSSLDNVFCIVTLLPQL